VVVAALLSAPALAEAVEGQPAPVLALPGHDGVVRDLGTLRNDGPVIVVFFRGGW
jgi:peroxiredoxin